MSTGLVQSARIPMRSADVGFQGECKLRGCDVVALKVEDVAPNGYTTDRATVRQKKTGHPVKFELTDQTRQAVDDYLKSAGKKPGEFLFTVDAASVSA
jgi:hypothetical protein